MRATIRLWTAALVCAAVAVAAAAPARADATPSGPPTPGQPVKNRAGVPIDQLTPVPPPPGPPRPARPAYQLYMEVDGPLLAVAGVFAIGRSIRGGLAPAYCAPAEGSATAATDQCDPSALNWLDRHFAGRYRPGWKKYSDIGLYGLEGLAVAGIMLDDGLGAGINDLVVIAEATMLASAASGLSTAVTGRPRPYMYGTEAPLATRQSGDGGLSYFSGHTSTSFGLVTSTFMTLHRLHPDDRWPWYVMAAGSVAAGFVGATRILAGQHFPTDVLAGAVVGVGIGVAVPAMHRSPHVTATPMAVDGGGGLAVAGRLP